MVRVITEVVRDMLALRRLKVALDADQVRTSVTGNVLVTVTRNGVSSRFIITVVEGNP